MKVPLFPDDASLPTRSPEELAALVVSVRGAVIVNPNEDPLQMVMRYAVAARDESGVLSRVALRAAEAAHSAMAAFAAASLLVHRTKTAALLEPEFDPGCYYDNHLHPDEKNNGCQCPQKEDNLDNLCTYRLLLEARDRIRAMRKRVQDIFVPGEEPDLLPAVAHVAVQAAPVQDLGAAAPAAAAVPLPVAEPAADDHEEVPAAILDEPQGVAEHPAVVPAGDPEEVPLGVPVEVPADPPAHMPAAVPDDVLAGVLVEVPEEVAGEVVLEEPSDEVPANVLDEVHAEVPAEAPAEVPADVPDEVHAEVPAEAPAEVPANVPAESPASTMTVDMLPDAVLVRVLRLLSPRQLLQSAAGVCRRWHDMALGREVWSRVHLHCDADSDSEVCHILRTVRHVGKMSLYDPLRLPRLMAMDTPLSVREVTVYLEQAEATEAASRCILFMQNALQDVRSVHLAGFVTSSLISAVHKMAGLQDVSLGFWNQPPDCDLSGDSALRAVSLRRNWSGLACNLLRANNKSLRRVSLPECTDQQVYEAVAQCAMLKHAHLPLSPHLQHLDQTSLPYLCSLRLKVGSLQDFQELQEHLSWVGASKLLASITELCLAFQPKTPDEAAKCLIWALAARCTSLTSLTVNGGLSTAVIAELLAFQNVQSLHLEDLVFPVSFIDKLKEGALKHLRLLDIRKCFGGPATSCSIHELQDARRALRVRPHGWLYGKEERDLLQLATQDPFIDKILDSTSFSYRI